MAGPSSVTDALSGEITLLVGTAESNGAPPGTGDFADGGAPPQGEQAEASQRWVGLKAGSAGGLDGVVTNGTGLTLYRFDRDSAAPPTSNCDGECAETWPTVLVGTDSCLFFDDGIDRAAVGSIPSGDGAYQLTIGGWPIYRFAEDTRAGQAGGQGVGGTWFAIGPDGTRRPVAAAPPTAVAVAVRALTTPTVLTARTVLGTVVARAATPPTGPPPSRPAVPTRSTAVPAAWVAASA